MLSSCDSYHLTYKALYQTKIIQQTNFCFKVLVWNNSMKKNIEVYFLNILYFTRWFHILGPKHTLLPYFALLKISINLQKFSVKMWQPKQQFSVIKHNKISKGSTCRYRSAKRCLQILDYIYVYLSITLTVFKQVWQSSNFYSILECNTNKFGKNSANRPSNRCVWITKLGQIFQHGINIL